MNPAQTAEYVVERGHALDLIASAPLLDLIATDPPYAFGGAGGEHALSATVATVLRESAHRLQKGGWAVVFAASSWRSTYYMIEAVRGILEPVRIGTWAKPKARSKVRTPGWAWASVNVIVFRRAGESANGSPSELLDYIVEPPYQNGRRAQLPEAVANWAVAPFVKPGGVMLDPFAGSGVLCRAAAQLGMRAIGYEVDEAVEPRVPPMQLALQEESRSPEVRTAERVKHRVNGKLHDAITGLVTVEGQIAHTDGPGGGE